VTEDRYIAALRLMPDGLYPKALTRIRRNTSCRIGPGGWWVWPVCPRHGHQPCRIDGYAADDYLAGQSVVLLLAPEMAG